MDDDNDWIFDYVLQFLESDRFEAAIMDFVDEKCDVFDNDEENKFIYTDIYDEFVEHMETIISSHLAELDITTDHFYEACQSSRSKRDINRSVFEKMLAMEDFTVFKKIMVKRNMELQFEAMQSYKHYHEVSQYGLESDLSHLPDPDELEAMLENREDEAGPPQTYEQIEALYRDSLLELEMIHKQEEMEQLELEQALALSLLAEEERLRRARVEAKTSASEDIREASLTSGAKDSADEKSSSKSSSKASSKGSSSSDHSLEVADPKPIKFGAGASNLTPMKALPPISAGKKANLSEMNANFLEKRKAAENAFKQNQQQITEKKRLAEELTKENPTAQQEAEKRAQYMREQRDKLIALKKRERDEKVREEEERQLKSSSAATAAGNSPPKRVVKPTQSNDQEFDEEYDSQEQQRAVLRMALARRMKQSLLESEEAKQIQQQQDSFSILDKKLQDVERQRQENHQRELILQENLRKQQAQMARNVQRSAAQLRNDT